MNVLSLCDGISCGRIALERANIKVDKYFASEIKENAIKVAINNYPDIIEIGDVCNVRYINGELFTEKGNFKTDIDLVIFGSPCQSFSIAIKKDMRVGLNDKKRSGIFLECYRILKEIKPKYFFFENVASMKKEDRDLLSIYLGVNPVRINSSLVSAALRDRYYWTNIPIIGLPANKDIKLQNILTAGYTDRDKARCLMARDCAPLRTPIKMFHRYYSIGFTTLIFKSKEHYLNCVKEYNKITGGKRKIKAEDLNNYSGSVFNGCRYMNQEGLEICQTMPKGYTSCLSRDEAANVLGDGWTIDIITWFFSFIN